ncbi:hypothetical protein M0802_004478 [Mischocyttarus mexicanus]|nr:hypothetical protein M0802_004478 [Mischocyttarus mexicanus]
MTTPAIHMQMQKRQRYEQRALFTFHSSHCPLSGLTYYPNFRKTLTGGRVVPLFLIIVENLDFLLLLTLARFDICMRKCVNDVPQGPVLWTFQSRIFNLVPGRCLSVYFKVPLNFPSDDNEKVLTFRPQSMQQRKETSFTSDVLNGPTQNPKTPKGPEGKEILSLSGIPISVYPLLSFNSSLHLVVETYERSSEMRSDL